MQKWGSWSENSLWWKEGRVLLMSEASEEIRKAVEDPQILRVTEGGKGCSERESSAQNLSYGGEGTF